MAGAVDRAMFGYFGSKHAAGEVIAGSGIPWTTLRATQFFDLTLATASALAKLPIVPLPSGFPFQPVDAGEVATAPARGARGRGPAGTRAARIWRAAIYTMDELLRSYLLAAGKRQRPIRVAGPGASAGKGAAAAAIGMRAGATLPRTAAPNWLSGTSWTNPRPAFTSRIPTSSWMC